MPLLAWLQLVETGGVMRIESHTPGNTLRNAGPCSEKHNGFRVTAMFLLREIGEKKWSSPLHRHRGLSEPPIDV
jgi:hypothetical protein